VKRTPFSISDVAKVLLIGLVAMIGLSGVAEWLHRRYLSRNPSTAYRILTQTTLPESVEAIAFAQHGWGLQNQSAWWHLKHGSTGLTNLLFSAKWGVDDHNLDFLALMPSQAGWFLPDKRFAHCYECEPTRGWNHFLFVTADGTESFLLRVRM